jgi:hypothetical protein
MVILNEGILPPQELHYGYPNLPSPELEKKPPAALEDDSIQPKCLQQPAISRILQEFLQSEKGKPI